MERFDKYIPKSINILRSRDYFHYKTVSFLSPLYDAKMILLERLQF